MSKSSVPDYPSLFDLSEYQVAKETPGHDEGSPASFDHLDEENPVTTWQQMTLDDLLSLLTREVGSERDPIIGR